MCFLQNFWGFCGTSSAFYPWSARYNSPPISLSSLFLPCFLDPTRSLPLLSSFSPSQFSAACLPSRPPPSVFPPISGLALSPLQRSVLHHSPSTPSTFSLSYKFQLIPDQTIYQTSICPEELPYSKYANKCGPFAQYFHPKTLVLCCRFPDGFVFAFVLVMTLRKE